MRPWSWTFERRWACLPLDVERCLTPTLSVLDIESSDSKDEPSGIIPVSDLDFSLSRSSDKKGGTGTTSSTHTDAHWRGLTRSPLGRMWLLSRATERGAASATLTNHYGCIVNIQPIPLLLASAGHEHCISDGPACAALSESINLSHPIPRTLIRPKISSQFPSRAHRFST